MCVFVLGYLTTISPFIYLPFYFSQLQRSVCTNGIYSLLPQHRYRLRMCTTHSSSAAAVAYLSLPLSLSLCLCSGVPHTISPFLYLPFYFFAATTKCLYKQHLLPTSLLASIIFRCDHGPDSLHAVICDKLTFFTGGCSEGLGAFRFFKK